MSVPAFFPKPEAGTQLSAGWGPSAVEEASAYHVSAQRTAVMSRSSFRNGRRNRPALRRPFTKPVTSRPRSPKVRPAVAPAHLAAAWYAVHLRSPPTANASIRLAPRRRHSARKWVTVEDAMHNWNCRGCGRTNTTVIEENGTVKCEHCGDVKSIQPSRYRGGESPAQIERFSRRNSPARVVQRTQ
jgi:hypothetical protein